MLLNEWIYLEVGFQIMPTRSIWILCFILQREPRRRKVSIWVGKRGKRVVEDRGRWDAGKWGVTTKKAQGTHCSAVSERLGATQMQQPKSLHLGRKRWYQKSDFRSGIASPLRTQRLPSTLNLVSPLFDKLHPACSTKSDTHPHFLLLCYNLHPIGRLC